ncbi:MAG: HAMP domain-containing histidine kinase [Lachnospiraceae bacterium]|nr:HAMP domain-containing histidine kinase [Lachnospiraceae bacterium]
MKKARLTNLAGGLACLFLSAFIAALAGSMIIKSFIRVSYLEEDKTYYLDPMRSSRDFTETEIFDDLFARQAEDVLRYVAAKRIMEAEAGYLPKRQFHINQYAVDTGLPDDCDVDVTFFLDDLVKWGRFGAGYSEVRMSLNDFLTYFGNIYFLDNFQIDGSDSVTFLGFKRVDRSFNGIDPGLQNRMMKNGLSFATIQKAILNYILTECPDYITVLDSEEDPSVLVNVLDMRCTTALGKRSLTQVCDNWVDFTRIQRNLDKNISELYRIHRIYTAGKQRFSEGNSNLIYVVRTDDDGTVRFDTNQSDYEGVSEEGLTEVFSENLQSLIYYRQTYEYSGLSDLDVTLLDHQMRLWSSVVYPADTKIWMYVDLDMGAEDSFRMVSEQYNSIRANIKYYLVGLLIMIMLWILFFVYLLFETGRYIGEDGEIRFYKMPMDHLFIETMLVLAFFAVRGMMHLYQVLQDATETLYVTSIDDPARGMNCYPYYALYGFGVCLILLMFTMSLSRRIKSHTLWTGSFLYILDRLFRLVYRRLYTTRSTGLSIILPYNLFLFFNIANVIFVYRMWGGNRYWAVVAAILLILVDALAGVMLVRSHAERKEIVNGIRRIRGGEVDYKISGEHMNPENAVLAEAVNNIGEGIESAVNTSMRDEKMKSDLITNVSHDLKTPLTSIINYVDLLQRSGMEQEPQAGYLRILADKSARLKLLLDDLLEASKISSGNIELNLVHLNLTELIRQCAGEFEENLAKKDLTLVVSHLDTAYIRGDGRRTWRIMDNLLQNVCKYAMSGTRVYITVHKENGKVELSVKNVADKPFTLQGKELTERFIRGDESRSTEGSGLGLFIARSLTQLQGGDFSVSVDGDLFKVTMVFPEEMEPEALAQSKGEEKDTK